MKSNIIRVLLADDSAVVRRLIAEALSGDSEITVVGAARDGGEVTDLLISSRADVVVLDVEMPVLDGVESVMEIRKIDRQIPIIMFSAITTRGAEATLDSLAYGANDYVAKPMGLEYIGDSIEYIRNALIPKIKLWGHRHRAQNGGPSKTTRPTTFATRHKAKSKTRNDEIYETPAKFQSSTIEIVAIGASTGGPDALCEVLRMLPRDFPVPIVVVQHMPAIFTQILAARLNTIGPLNVREGVDGTVLKAGDAWIAPGDYHMSVRKRFTDRVLRLEQSMPEHSCRPSVNPLFRSIATVYGDRALGVVLTGMGRDGESGCGAIKQAGGRIIVQDEASSVVWGMPRAVAEANLADQVVPLSQIAAEISDAVGHWK